MTFHLNQKDAKIQLIPSNVINAKLYTLGCLGVCKNANTSEPIKTKIGAQVVYNHD